MAFSKDFSDQLLAIVDTTEEQLVANAIEQFENLMFEQLRKNEITLELYKFRWISSSSTFYDKFILQLYKNFCTNLGFRLETTNVYNMEKKSICFLKVSEQSTQREAIYEPCDITLTKNECSKIVLRIR